MEVNATVLLSSIRVLKLCLLCIKVVFAVIFVAEAVLDVYACRRQPVVLMSGCGKAAVWEDVDVEWRRLSNPLRKYHVLVDKTSLPEVTKCSPCSDSKYIGVVACIAP